MFVTAIVEQCTTPDNLDGQCQPIRSCQKLFDIFENKPVSESNTKYLRQSRCEGADDTKIYVCCALPPVVTAKPIKVILNDNGTSNGE